MKILSMVFCLLAFASFDARAEEKASRESVERLMELTEVSKMMDAIQAQAGGMFESFAEQLKISEKERPAFDSYKQKLVILMSEEVSWEKMKEPILEIYMKHFTEAEVKGLIEFYSSELGQSMIRKMPVAMQESMGVSQEMMKSIMPKIQLLAMEMQKEIAEARKQGDAD